MTGSRFPWESTGQSNKSFKSKEQFRAWVLGFRVLGSGQEKRSPHKPHSGIQRLQPGAIGSPSHSTQVFEPSLLLNELKQRGTYGGAVLGGGLVR